MANPSPRHGSLQFYPRKRAERILPRVNWSSITRKESGLLGFIGYKVGMKSAYIRDNTPHSLTKGQRIVIPVTIVECPKLKTISIRFYKNNIVAFEFLNKNLEKELKRKIKLPKKEGKKLEDLEKQDFDDVRILVYSQVKKTGIKKSPDIAEIAISGDKNQKLELAKNIFNKEVSIKDVFKDEIVDIRAVTKGKGTVGPVKRFGLNLRSHKAEKGVRFHGSGGAWHPARVEFTQPMAGQMGFSTRVQYNSKIVNIGNILEKNINPPEGFNAFGKINTDYLILSGSVQGPAKRPLIITFASRPTITHSKRSYEFIELR